MKSQLNNLAFWVGGILLVVLVTVFYQPAAAKTGSLLVWQDGQIYVLDIDSLERRPVGPAGPDALTREIAHLHRCAHQLIWLNPLLGSPDYQPLTRGMRAALPHIDRFLPAHNLASF